MIISFWDLQKFFFNRNVKLFISILIIVEIFVLFFLEKLLVVVSWKGSSYSLYRYFCCVCVEG